MQQPSQIIIPQEFFDGVEKVGLQIPQALEALSQSLFRSFIQRIGAWQPNSAPQQNLINAKVRREVNKDDFRDTLLNVLNKWLDVNSFNDITPISTKEELSEVESFVRKVFLDPKKFEDTAVLKLMKLYDKLCRSNRGIAQVENRAVVRIILVQLARSSVYMQYERHKPAALMKAYSEAIDICVKNQQINEDSLKIMQILSLTEEKHLVLELLKLTKQLKEQKDNNLTQFINFKKQQESTVSYLSISIVERIVQNLSQNNLLHAQYHQINILTQAIQVLQSTALCLEHGFDEVVPYAEAVRVFSDDATFQDFYKLYKSQETIKASLHMIYKRLKEGKDRQHLNQQLNSREMLASFLRTGFNSKENEDNLKQITIELRKYHNKNQMSQPLTQPTQRSNGISVEQLERDLLKIFQSNSHRTEILQNFKDYARHIRSYQVNQMTVVFERDDAVLFSVQKSPQNCLSYFLVNPKEVEGQRKVVVESFKEAMLYKDGMRRVS